MNPCKDAPGLSKDAPLGRLNDKIIRCKKCPRLVKYLNEIKQKLDVKTPQWGVSSWCKPVPSFGDINARILIVGLAPGRFGSNRTGRMFTGDSSGDFMYKILYEVGLCNKSESKDINDGLVLKNCYITAVGRCAPPQNKPTPKELANCFPYFVEELKLLKNIKVVIALGKIAFDGYVKWGMKNSVESQFIATIKKKDFKFSHGAIYEKEFPHILIASYHPSRQNTQTGRLTPRMFKDIFINAIECC